MRCDRPTPEAPIDRRQRFPVGCRGLALTLLTVTCVASLTPEPSFAADHSAAVVYALDTTTRSLNWQTATPETTVALREYGLEVRSDVSRYHYQLVSETIVTAPNRAYRLDYEISVTAGGMTIGLVDAVADRWIMDRHIGVGDDGSGRLSFIAPSKAVRVVLANNNRSRTRSSAEVVKLEVVAERSPRSAATIYVLAVESPSATWSAVLPETRVVSGDGFLRVVSDSSKYHYQLWSPRLGVTTGRRYRVEYRIDVTVGEMGLGVLDGVTDTWLVNRSLDAATGRFEFVAASEAVRLVLYNDNSVPTVSEVEVRHLGLVTAEDGAGRPPDSRPVVAAAPANRPQGLAAARAFFPDWESSSYNRVGLDVDGDWLVVRGGGSPAGLFLRRRLDTARRYRLRIHGTPVGRTATLRVRRDGDAPTHSVMVAGEFSLTVGSTRELELLFYADEAFAYAIETLTLEECPQCKMNTDLRDRVLADVPELRATLGRDPFRGARLLLDWASNEADVGFDSWRVERLTQLAATLSAADLFYDVLQPDVGGFICGGASVFLDKLLKLFGYDSFTINFGEIDKGLSHVTVVVPLERDGTRKFFLFDPTVNVTFRRPNGDYVSIDELLRDYARDALSGIVLDQGDLSRRDYLVPNDPLDSRACPVLDGVENGIAKCRIPGYGFDYYFAGKSFPAWGGQMARNGYRTGLAGFLQLLSGRIMGVGEALDPSVRAQFIDLMRGLGVEVS